MLNKELVALENINLDIEYNTFANIIGQSGCDKSTLLSIIASLSFSSGFSVVMNREPITGPKPDHGRS